MNEAVVMLFFWGLLIVVACGVLIGWLLAGTLYVAGRESDQEEQEPRAW